jgi:hypothetical protein
MSNRGHQRNPHHHAAGGKARYETSIQRYETPRRYETQGWTPMPWRSTNDACRTHAALSSPLTATKPIRSPPMSRQPSPGCVMNKGSCKR